MFFMVTYRALGRVSFLEHFSGKPSYRPTFRSRWYMSLLGSLPAFFIMLRIKPFYALLSFLLLGTIYVGLRYTWRGERDLAAIFQGVMFQFTRWVQITLQKSRAGSPIGDWWPVRGDHPPHQPPTRALRSAAADLPAARVRAPHSLH